MRLRDDLLHPDEAELLAPAVIRLVDLAAALATLALILVAGVGWTGPPRIVLALAFVTFVPGWAAVGHSHAVGGTSKMALAVALSLTVCTATALAMAWLGSWHPLGLFYGIGGVSVAMLARQAHRRPAAPVVEQPTLVEAKLSAAEVVDPDPVAGASVVGAPIPPAAPAIVPPSGPDSLVPDEPAIPPEPTLPGIHGGPARRRSGSVPRDDLRLTRAAVHAVFLPRQPFGPRELPEFFAAITHRHPFADFHRDAGEGAVMETAGTARLEVRRDGVDYVDLAPTALHQVRQDVVDLLGEVRGRLGVESLANPSCRLQAHWDPGADRGEATQLLARVAGVDDGWAAVLGSTGPIGVDLRLSGNAGTPAHDWQLVLEQDATDGHVTIDLIADFHVPASPGAVGEHLQQSHRFLTGNVVRFLESLRQAAPGGP